MSILRFRSGATSGVLVLLMSLGPGAAAVMAEAAETAGSISVTSDPVGAEVYVDGRFEGETPLRLDGVAAGSHRVTLVKQGYLENRRVVDVAPGGTLDLAVPLSEGAPASARLQGGSASSGGGGGGGKKALLIGLGVAAAGAGAYFAFRDTNDPPTIPNVSCSPTTGLASATSVSCNAQATDPDGDSLTYSWDFGDSGSGSGPSASHTYTSAGSYSVTVRVSDGKETVSGSGNVTIRDLTGTWTGAINVGGFSYGTTVTLTQSGSTLSGSFLDMFGMGGPVPSGSVSSPLNVRFVVAPPGFEPWTFSGTADASLDRLTGRADGSGFTGQSWTLSR